MEVNSFQILLIDVTFYLNHILNVVLDVLIKMKTRIYAAPVVKGLKVNGILALRNRAAYGRNVGLCIKSDAWVGVICEWVSE